MRYVWMLCFVLSLACRVEADHTFIVEENGIMSPTGPYLGDIIVHGTLGAGETDSVTVANPYPEEKTVRAELLRADGGREGTIRFMTLKVNGAVVKTLNEITALSAPVPAYAEVEVSLFDASGEHFANGYILTVRFE